jgi:hypothetical protein
MNRGFAVTVSLPCDLYSYNKNIKDRYEETKIEGQSSRDVITHHLAQVFHSIAKILVSITK